MTRPGAWLRTVAARVCAQSTIERLVDPIFADIQTEHDEAVWAGRRGRAAWVRITGYAVFWKAVGLHALQSAARSRVGAVAPADGWTLARTIGYSLIGFVSATLLLTAPPVINSYSRVEHGLELTMLLLPQAIPLSIPIALCLGIVWGVSGRDVQARRIRGVVVLAATAALLALAAMLMVPVANHAFRVLTAKELESRGITEYSLPKGVNELTLSELATGIRQYDAGGLPETARRFRRTYHMRFALPAATLVLSLLALGVGGTVRRRALRVVAMAVVFVLYWATLAVSEANAILPPLVAVWAPNVLFTTVSVVLLKVSWLRSAQRHG